MKSEVIRSGKDLIWFNDKKKTAYEIGVRLVGSEMCIRDRSWIVKLKNTRIAYANEVSMDASLDASVIKTISSGGDPITARQNYGDECTFRLQTTAIFFVNEQKDD